MMTMLTKQHVWGDAVISTPQHLAEFIAAPMRDSCQACIDIPQVVHGLSDNRFDGPKHAYDYNVDDTALRQQRVECVQQLAAEAGVATTDVVIIGASEPSPSLKSRISAGKVVVKWQLRRHSLSCPCRDLLRRLLTHHPDYRISFQDFLKHEWLESCRRSQ